MLVATMETTDLISGVLKFHRNMLEFWRNLLPVYSEYVLNLYEIVQLFIPEANIFYNLDAIWDFMFKSESHM